MKKSYFNSGGNDTELIAVLNAISHISARMARNMTILAQQRQSEKGERRYNLCSWHRGCRSQSDPYSLRGLVFLLPHLYTLTQKQDTIISL